MNGEPHDSGEPDRRDDPGNESRALDELSREEILRALAGLTGLELCLYSPYGCSSSPTAQQVEPRRNSASGKKGPLRMWRTVVRQWSGLFQEVAQVLPDC